MNPKKRLRTQRALTRRQLDLHNWLHETPNPYLTAGQVKKKVTIAEQDIANLEAKLWPSAQPQ